VFGLRLPRLSLRLPRVRGTIWDGPACFTDDYQLVPRPGHYALERSGKRLARPLLRLTYVDHAADDVRDSPGHYIVAGRKDPPVIIAPATVELEFHGEGEATIGA
jgi:hypothetical protein